MTSCAYMSPTIHILKDELERLHTHLPQTEGSILINVITDLHIRLVCVNCVFREFMRQWQRSFRWYWYFLYNSFILLYFKFKYQHYSTMWITNNLEGFCNLRSRKRNGWIQNFAPTTKYLQRQSLKMFLGHPCPLNFLQYIIYSHMAFTKHFASKYLLGIKYRSWIINSTVFDSHMKFCPKLQQLLAQSETITIKLTL